MDTFFSDRLKLANMYENWLKENQGVKDCTFSILTYLDGINMLKNIDSIKLKEV